MKDKAGSVWAPLAVLAAIFVLTTASSQAATMSASTTPPVVDNEDIASYGTPTGQDKWWPGEADAFGNAGKTVGQTFTTGSEVLWLTAFTFQIGQPTEPTKEYTIRVGTVYGVTFTGVHTETAPQSASTEPGDYWTWTLDAPVLLAANTVYGVDVGLNSSTSSWQTGIPYVYTTDDVYSGGTRFRSGTEGDGVGDDTMTQVSGDRVFHFDLSIAYPVDPGYASPANGAMVSGGDVELSWTNLRPNAGSDVWVDVWFGTDPLADFTKVIDAGLNATGVTVNAPADGRYYWQVDSCIDGSPTSDPVQGPLLTFFVDDSSEGELVSALTALSSHFLNDPLLTPEETAAHKATIDEHAPLFASRHSVIEAALALVETYDTEVGPLFVAGSPVQSFRRSSVSDSDGHWVVYNVMQHIVDHTYTAANIERFEALLDNFKFGTADFFPGRAAPPPDPEATHAVSIDASYPDTWGHDTMYTPSPARRPTGAYLAPGSIATITVPSALVGRGYSIRVCAHSWDFSNKPTIKRLDRCSLVYLIESTRIRVASPLGGGVYVQVPRLADAGVVEVLLENVVRSPFFSAKSFHSTTLSEWQSTERHHPGPWADFQSEKFLMQVPTDWIYDFDDPATLMQEWDAAMDALNDLMGYPGQGKETMYPQVDLYLRASVYAPGYPSVNERYDPDRRYGGDHGHHLLKGPRYAPDYLFHEEGHGYLFQKFPGETESNVNLHHVAVWHQKLGYDLDYAFAASRGFQQNPHRTLDNTAVAWMTVFNFSFYEAPMASGEKAYQLKGHAKFVDLARLFGWQVLNDYWYSFNEDHESGEPIDSSIDGLLLRLSIAAGVDIRPLFHFWGTHPEDPPALAAAIAAAGLQPSGEILDTLLRYRTSVPEDNAAFQAFARGWWGREPDIGGYWTEREHTRQWDTTSYWQDNEWDYCGTDPAQADGEVYTEATAARIKAVIDGLISLYFPSAGLSFDFQQDREGYTGTVDTFLLEADPDADMSAASEVRTDGDDPGGSGQDTQALLRFENIFGEGENQIRPGTPIQRAVLRLATTDPGSGASLHRMRSPWDPADGWSAYGGDGVQVGVEALTDPDIVVDASAGGTVEVDVTVSLNAWSSAPCRNHGWALLPIGDDGWEFHSADGDEPPELHVVTRPPVSDQVTAPGDEWQYFKGTREPPPAWNQLGFVPTADWLGGPTGIGYGDGDDVTVLDDMLGSYASVFCRREFELGSAVSALRLRIDYDDGFAAFINGVEVARSTSLAAPTTALSWDMLARSGREAGVSEVYELPTSSLVSGTNVLAIQVHNTTLDSSDLSLIPELLADYVLDAGEECESLFRRGDCNDDGAIDITDAIFTLNYLFAGGAAPTCLDAADANDDGAVDITDPIAELMHLFIGAGNLPGSFGNCGVDPTADGLGCSGFAHCRDR